jgi:Ca-activated chloride channel family protein
MNSYLDFQFLPALLGLLLIPFAIVIRFMFGRARVGVIPYATSWRKSEHGAGTASVAVWWYLSVILLVMALAEPVRVTESTVTRSIGADVVIAIDVSTSMLAEDLSSESAPRDRLAVLKPALIEFIKSDSIGRVGLVLFAGRAYTLVPLSADQSWLQSQLQTLEIGDIEDGTAIGDGLGLAVTRFAISEPADRARMIMLLTDGSNTSGMMTPPQAAAIAKKFSIPIHSVAMGRDGYVPYPVINAEGRRIGSRQQPSSVDRSTLMMIATETGGSHQDAATGEQLELALRQISSRLAVVTKAEKTLARHALSHWLMLAACLTLVCLLVQLHREGAWASRQGMKILDGHVQGGRFRAESVIPGLQRAPVFLIGGLSGVLLALWIAPSGSADKDPPGRQVLIAMDLSRSMDIVDEYGASRADLASRLASRLLGELPAETAAGVLVFAGSAHLVAPITRERVLAERALNSFGSTHVPSQGSSYLELLKAASAAFDPTVGEKVLVLLSDGEANPQDWAGSIGSLRTNGIRVVAVGFGEEKTSPVPDAAGGWLRDPRGLFVYAKPQPENMRRLATATGGVLIRSRENATLLRELLRAVLGETTSDTRRSADVLSAADGRRLLLSLVLVVLLFAAWREVPARVRLAALGSRSAQLIAASGLVIGLLSMPVVAQFARPLQTIQSAEERDALNEVNAVVRRILARTDVTAQDYRTLALAAANYGAIHRLHAHPISEGVLRDGLLAVQRGRQLDPRGSDWERLERQLQRLLEPPPPVVADDGEVDPANEPLEGKLAMDSGGVPEPAPAESPASADASVADDVTSPGGGAADEFGAAEWRDASVAVPLYLLREVERGDSYAELFRQMQGRSGGREIVTAKPSQGW